MVFLMRDLRIRNGWSNDDTYTPPYLGGRKRLVYIYIYIDYGILDA